MININKIFGKFATNKPKDNVKCEKCGAKIDDTSVYPKDVVYCNSCLTVELNNMFKDRDKLCK